jgi:hypothetical protein
VDNVHIDLDPLPYSEYVRLRLQASIASGVTLTPSVTHTYDKMRKGHMTLALNGIAATQEMHRLKEKVLRRARLEEGRQLYVSTAQFASLMQGCVSPAMSTIDRLLRKRNSAAF